MRVPVGVLHRALALALASLPAYLPACRDQYLPNFFEYPNGLYLAIFPFLIGMPLPTVVPGRPLE